MATVAVEIVRFTDDRQPGFVECRLTDVDGRGWWFEEKAPVVSAEFVDATSRYPRVGTIGCRVLERSGDKVHVSVDPLSDPLECRLPASSVAE